MQNKAPYREQQSDPSRGHDVPQPPDAKDARPRRKPGLVAVYAVAAVLGAQWISFLVTNERFQWGVVAEYLFHPLVMRGLGVTLLLTGLCMVIGLVLGTAIALFRLSDVRPLRVFAAAWTTGFRSIPPLVQLLFWYNLAYLLPEISLGIPFGPAAISWPANEIITPFTAAVIGISLYQSPYSAEVVRAGLLSVPSGQLDAAQAMGYTPRQIFWGVRVPQSMRVIIPPTGNDLIRTAKGTSLVSIIAMTDLLGAVQEIYSRNFNVIPLLIVAVIWYFVLISSLWVFQSRLERHFGKGYASRRRT